MENLLLEMALKQRQSDLMAQRSVLLEKIQKLENARYEAMFTDKSQNVDAETVVNIQLSRRRVDVISGQIQEVKFWLFEMLPSVG